MTEQDAANDSSPDDAEGNGDSGAADRSAAEAGDGDAGSAEAVVDENGGAEGPVADVTGDADPETELVERVAERDAEAVAGEIAGLRSAVSELEEQLAEREAEVEDLESRLARKQADFQNYKKRQEQRMADVRARATEDLVTRLLDVRDNLARALEQGEDADIRGGVESTLQQFDEELDQENVAVIEPEPGEETDPTRHEVLMRVDSDRPEGTVEGLHRPGYEMGGKVLRPAQVTVSDGSGDA